MTPIPQGEKKPAGLAGRWLARHLYRYRALDQGGYRVFSWLLGLTVVLMLVAGAAWLVRPHYRHYKEQRAAALAESFLEKDDPKNAQLRARQALALNPANLVASRVMARLAAAAHSPAELDWWQKVAQAEPTPENKMLVAEAALNWQQPPFSLTAQTLGELASSEADNARYQTLAARLAMARRELSAADEHWAAAVRLDPTNVNYVVNLAVFRLGQTNEAGRAEARARLQTLRTDPLYGPAALRALATDRILQKDFPAANDYSTQLLASSAATLRDRLQNLDILRELKSDDLAKRLQAVWQSEQTNAAAVAVISAWMQANGLLAENRQWLEDLPGLENQQPVELALAGAYDQSGDWQSLLDYTAHGNWGKLDYLRLATAAHAAAQLKMTALAHENWDSAVTEATGQLRDLHQLTVLAARWQMNPETTALLERTVRDFPGEEGAVLSLARRYASAGNTPAIHQLFARMSALYPTNNKYQANWAATSLLLQTNVAEASQWLAAAYAKTPDNPQVTSLYAYTLHLQNEDAAGIAALAKLAPTNLAQPSPALYYGLLLTSAGQPGEAAKWLRLARDKETVLLPEEKQLLESALPGK